MRSIEGRMAWIAALAALLVAGGMTGCGKCTEKADSGKAPVPPATQRPVLDVSGLPGAPQAAPKVDPATVLVEVDGVKLTAGETETQMTRWMGAMGQQVPPDRQAEFSLQLRRRIADQFVMKTVLSNEAERHKIEVTDAEITDAIREVRERLQQQGTSLEAVMQKEQIAESELRANLKGELRIKKLVELNVSTNLTPTAAEIDEFYAAQKANFQTPESVHARHILVKFGEKDDAKAKAEKKAKAESLQKKLVEGADFAQVARENSEDVSNKDRGGDLGTFGRGQMVPEFETAAFGQATNEIGPVIETMFGYHIVQVLEHQPASEMAADEAKEKIVAFLKRKLEQEAFKSFIDALKAKAKIVYASEELRPMESGMRAPGARMAPASGQPAGGAAPVPAPAAQAAAAPAATPVPAPGAKVESAAPSPAAAPAPATTTATP